MKQCKRSNLLVVWAVAIFLAGSSNLFAQVADLPLKAGLWETQVKIKMGNAGTDNDEPVTSQVCFSAGLTLAGYMSALNHVAGGTRCTVSNRVRTDHGLSYDSACTGATLSSKGHADFKLADANHFSGPPLPVVPVPLTERQSP